MFLCVLSLKSIRNQLNDRWSIQISSFCFEHVKHMPISAHICGTAKNIQIKTALSVDKVRILIKSLTESNMAFNWEIKLTFDSTQTDRPVLALTFCLSVCYRMLTLSNNWRPIWFSNKILKARAIQLTCTCIHKI